MLKVRQIKISPIEDSLAKRIETLSQILKIKPSDILKIEISKKSIDARDKENIYFVYEFNLQVNDEEKVLKKVKSKDIFSYQEEFFKITRGNNKLKSRIIIVGSGPAGLFAGYLLAQYGYKPLIIERGKKIEERIVDVEKYWKDGTLNLESNVQFGEGGAGTFSDGKLNTLIKDKDKLKKKVLEIFVENGAPEEILYLQNPHIGTDLLRIVIKNMRENIFKMGGAIRYQTKLTNLMVENNSLVGIEVNYQEKILCQHLILAIGHSARDTIDMLLQNKLEMTSKPFAVGVRVMHQADMINENQYGKFKDILGSASYKLTYTTKKGRGVYSFCMCPGGYVVASASEKYRLVINGMSNYKRDTITSNSAIVVTVSQSDFGDGILDGVKFQRDLEAKAYKLGNGNIPLQLWKDFLANRKSTELGSIKPITKGKYVLANLREMLPPFIIEALLEAMPNFAKKIKGFANSDVILAGIETRTSSPIKIMRNASFEANIKGIYPSGEGAGYAGGITSSAIDGLKIAKFLIEKYRLDK